MQIKLNKKEIVNKIYGCWLGKNIGGTMGAPFEGKQELLDIKGFTTEKGAPVPNDDLDLQIIWLAAMEKVGPRAFNANVLAEYWLTCISPHWNEYGIGKSNLRMGLLPPLSGEVGNYWKDSNGAWIRSEIWACLAPGFPNVAVKYAIMDASVDHGLAEGTYAEIFTAALESIAFFETDIRRAIDKALTFIPQTCRVARSVNIVLNAYDQKIPWQETRERILEENRDLGWFQAPGNVAFVILGLIYGEGDMKRSLILSINCGDDTDCTGGTCGAVLGIMLGADKIPEELKDYVGDRIETICINRSYSYLISKTCTDLTQRVVRLLSEVLTANDVTLTWTEEENQLDLAETYKVGQGVAEAIFARSPYSFEIPGVHTHTVVEYETEPRIQPGVDFKVKVTLHNLQNDARYYTAKAYLPEGWSADYDKSCHSRYKQVLYHHDGVSHWEMTIHTGENVEAVNQIPLIFYTESHANPIYVPIVLLG